VGQEDFDGLVGVLVDAVDSGASVSFMAGLTREEAGSWWRSTVAALLARGAVLVARDEGGICGNVLLQPAWAPNQPHRAEVAKLIVHRRARRQGLGDALMAAVEGRAREAGFTLLTLDTVRAREAERLYLRRGWKVAGIIPGYALEPDGALCDTVVFYKAL
jgi:GNAT superfamily N-acetyltransferase